uniref:Uncharacterized protein n=1 Tax=Romanomermis culicivorax TaxID=13658 RepID=A0A915HW06_ROMCU
MLLHMLRESQCTRTNMDYKINFRKLKMGKGAQNCQQARTQEWSHTGHHIEFGKPKEWQDNHFFFID